MAQSEKLYDAWNPGLKSEIPSVLLPLVTLYNAKNSKVSYQEAKDAADFCGLKPEEMVALSVGRLAIHEVLIRVTADLYVPDGPNYEELGLNLRSMAARILKNYVDPKMQDLEDQFSKIRAEVEKFLDTRLNRDIYDRDEPLTEKCQSSFFIRFFTNKKPAPTKNVAPEILALSEWHDEISKIDAALEIACLKGLHTIVGGIVRRHGRLLADKDLIVRLTTNWVCNSYGSHRIGEIIQPMILEAVKVEGYRLLPYQADPFVMNVKGASGAGKSTIRPLQRELAERLGIRWEDFALISPDYWRKFLIDYRSLGVDFKYAAMLTGQELEIIDKKLDGYMEEKALRAELPHLLIDRFRFDSFASFASQQTDGRLLSRFGHTVFMFFIITPPTETVKRAWNRGKETGRYKAVDDLLYHNIEAYTGMPQLFFSSVNNQQQKVHFEFLDNSVPYGDRPKTVAFGWNNKIIILNPNCMRTLNSFSRINVDAKRPEDVYLDAAGPEDDILMECVEKIQSVIFADPDSLSIFGQTYDGKCVHQTDTFFAKISLEQICCNHAAEEYEPEAEGRHMTVDAVHEKKFTVGMWGGLPRSSTANRGKSHLATSRVHIFQ